MKRALAVLVGATVVAASAIARADGRDEPTTVPVHVAIPGSVSLRGVGPLADARAGCTGPCTLHLVPGEYRYFGGGRTNEPVAFTGPSHLSLEPPSQPLHTTGLVLVGVGVLAIAVPLIAIFSTCERTDALGRTTERRCFALDRGADLPLTIVAGGGLALAAIGGILYFVTGGGLTVTDLEPNEPLARLRLGRPREARAASPFRLDLAHGRITF